MDDDLFFEMGLKQGRKRAKSLEAAEIYLAYVTEEQGWDAALPHCDERVLHSPGICIHCDTMPALQQYRRGLGLPFTDDLQANDPLLPGENRSRASAEIWGGNRRSDV